MASFTDPMNLRPYGTRAQIMRIPPVPAPSTSNRWTALYLVSHPLPAHVSIVQFDIISHDQGWCTNPQEGIWSWFEVSILGSWQENANPDLHNLSDTTCLRPCPEDFGQALQEQGLYFKDISQERNEGGRTGPSVISVPVARNKIQREWQHQTITWTQSDNYGDDGGFLPLLEEGDRLVIWARAQFPGWINCVKAVRVMISTDALQRAPENRHSLSAAVLTERGQHDDEPRMFRSVSDLEEAIRMSRQALLFTPNDRPDLATYLSNSAAELAIRYERTRQIDDLNEAIRLCRQGVQFTPNDHPDLAGRLRNLGANLANRYERTGQIDNLEEAIRLCRQAVQFTPNDHPDLAGWLSYLGTTLESRYKRTGQIDDLEEAIRVSREAVRFMSHDDPNLATSLTNLGTTLERRYERIGQIHDLEEAIRVSRHAVQVTPNDYPNRATFLTNLGTKLASRYERTRQIDDLEEAIRISRQAVQFTPNDHPHLAGRLINLGTMLEIRYKHTGQIDDLEEAIRISRRAVQVTPNDDPNLAIWLSHLSTKLERRYERIGQIDDLEEAIQVSRQAVQFTPHDHPNLATSLNTLGTNLSSRYNRIGQIDDLEEAIRVSRRAVEITPSDHPGLASYLNNLGNKLGRRYKRTGQIDDLDEAIRVSRQAVQFTPNDHPRLAVLLINLGTMLEIRYKRTGQIDYLEEAIRVSLQAVQFMPNDHPDLAGMLSNLSVALASRYKRTGQIDDLDEAIRLCRQAVQFTPNDHPDLTGKLSNLGVNLASRYERTRQIDDLDEAIRVSRQAVQFTPNDHPDLALLLSNLGGELSSRYKCTGQIDDLEDAIRVSRQAVQFTPNDHPDLAGGLYTLGTTLEMRYERTGQMDDLEEATRVSRHAVEVASAPPLNRIQAVILTVRLLLKRRDHNGAYTLFVKAIDLLHLVHNRSLSLQDQQYVVSHFSGLATGACSLALQTGQPVFKALELLERGRGVILSLLMDDRSDTSELNAANPALCELYESLRVEVNTPTESTISQRTREAMSTRRPKALEELEKCIQDIRQLPGFGSFQKGLTAEQMKTASNQGSIVIVNVTDLRSDAIVVSSAGYSLVPLPRIDAVQAQNWINQELTSASPSDRGVKNKVYRRFLVWLWRGCVKPILTELNHQVESSLENLPRVWWIGTGLASSFPFHAASDVSVGPAENTFCRVLSSYTPSVKALIHARGRVSTTALLSERPLKLLMVTMVNTPGADDLPGVKAETSTIKGVLGTSVHANILDQPDAASVMRQIRQSNLAHFACHGISDSVDPSQSGLILQTATAQPRQDILTVLKLCENHPAQGEIAYLSACSTAENLAKDLLDEVLHVVSGFQVAGFRHVIGSLWPSDDNVCVEVARSFYAELCRNGSLHYNDRAVAMALHKAVLKVSKSDDYRKRPLHWAQYVHYGA